MYGGGEEKQNLEVVAAAEHLALVPVECIQWRIRYRTGSARRPFCCRPRLLALDHV
jgi:hypothetical protein